MLDCLELIQDDCPEVAKEGIEAGLAYCEGSITVEDLENARVKCWKYYKNIMKSMILKQKKLTLINLT